MFLHRTLLFSMLAAGCQSGTTSSPIDGGPRDLARPPDLEPLPPDFAIPLRDTGDHPPGPQVTFDHGYLLHKVDLITVVWAGDPDADRRAAFGSWLADSSYLDLMAEYGGSRGTAEGPYFIKTPPPQTLDDSAVGNLLRSRIAAGDLPPAHAGSLYLLYLDHSTRSTLHQSQGCSTYGGYHAWTTTGTTPTWMAYAIMPWCNTNVDDETITVTHEVVEAMSDPDVLHGYRDFNIPYGEIGDLCTSLKTLANVDIPDGGTTTYAVSRFWSAKNAKDGTVDPCVPVPLSPYVYFNAALDPNTVNIVLDASNKGMETLLIEPFAMGNVGKIFWRLHLDGIPGISASPFLGNGMAGSTQTVTLRASALAQSGTWPFWISATSSAGDNVLYGAITVQ